MVAFQGGSEGMRREKCLVTNFKIQQFFKKITNNNKRQQKVPLAPPVEETAGQTEERASTSLNNL